MKIGLHFVNFDVPGGMQALPTTLASTAQTAEQAGAAWFTMADHFYQMDNLWPAESPMLEVYTSLGYLAGQTERIKLVVLVNGIMYRHPGLLAKTLRLVAQYADSWNGAFQTVEEAAHKVDVLQRHCEAVGRDPAEIQKTVMMLIDPLADLDEFLTGAEQYARLGFDLIDVMPPVDETDPVGFRPAAAGRRLSARNTRRGSGFRELAAADGAARDAGRHRRADA